MPVIPTERYERQTRVDPAVLLAIMAFPRDEEERRRYLLSLHGRTVGDAESHLRQAPDFEPFAAGHMLGNLLGKLLAPLGGFSAFAQAPSFDQMLQRIGVNSWPGSIAGNILLHLIQMRAAGLDTSVNKSIAIELDDLAHVKRAEGAPKGGKEKRYVQQAWEDFKPACHLWAARQMVSRDLDLKETPELYGDVLLAISDVLLGLALTIHPKRSRESLLRAEEMWRLPRRYRHQRVVTKFTIPPLEEWKLEVLQREFKSMRP